MFYGLLDLPWWGYVLYTCIATQITILTVTIFLHRCQAHRALTLHPILSHFFRFWLWMTTGMETKAWAAIHRKHHAKCETEEDPHSPQILSLPVVLWQGAELYRIEAKNKETLDRYGAGTPDDWLERNLYSKHSALGIKIQLVLNLLFFGVPGLTIWAIQMAWIPFFAAGIVNGIGHFWGYRNFECPDASTNISPIGFFIGGEELHNNHHTYPTSAKFSVKWWEFDIGWVYISLFKMLGLAKVKRVVPKPKILPYKQQIDAETLKALLHNRFQVMSIYASQVMKPAFSQAKGSLGSRFDHHLLRRVKNHLVRDKQQAGNDERAQRDLDTVVASSQQLKTAYQYRKALQAIWDQTTASQKELLDALQEWCAQAEASGLKYLEDFVAYIRGYSVSTSPT